MPSTSSVREIAACPPSPIADNLSALPSLPSSPSSSKTFCLFTRCQPLCASYCTVLLYFSRYCTVRSKRFPLFCVCLFFICVKSIINLCPWNSPGKNTGVGCHFLLQGIFLTQGSRPGLLHCRQIPHCLNHQKSPSKNGKFFKIYWAVFKRNFWHRFTGNNLNKQENNYYYWNLQK